MLLLGLLIIATVAKTIEAEVDCNKPPAHLNINSCCEISNMIWHDVREKCSQMKGGDGPPPQRGHHKPSGDHRGPLKRPCHATCIINATGVLIDGELQVDNVNAYLNRLFGDNENVEFVREKFMSCYEKRNEFASKIPERHGRPHCPFHENDMLLGCVSMSSFTDCPDASWANTDECNAVRDHFNQCWFSNDREVEKEEQEEV